MHEYRRIQREMRVVFDPFTKTHCSGCVTPCCVKPTRVTPLDVALAQSIGHAFPHLAGADPLSVAADHAAYRLGLSAIGLPMAPGAAEDEPLVMCEFLYEGRCTFPDDLRPFGCTAYLCRPMHDHLDPIALRKLKRLSRGLEEAHAALVKRIP